MLDRPRDDRPRDTQPPPSTRHSIGSALNHQVEALQRLRKTQAELRERLSPVLGPPLPAGESGSKISREPVSILEQIDAVTAVIEMAAYDVCDLMQRLEL